MKTDIIIAITIAFGLVALLIGREYVTAGAIVGAIVGYFISKKFTA